MVVDTRLPVTVVGLGAMGRALAGAFLDRGHPTTVWNRTAARAEEPRARGAAVAATVAEAVAAGPVVVVCVLDHRAVREVLGPVADALAGRTVVNLTNGTPEQAREAARWVERHGARYLDGGIMAVPPMIGGPDGFVLYSGSRGAFEEYEELLAGVAAAKYVGGDAGAASVQDAALLVAMYGMFGGFLHAAALVRSAGVPAAEFAPMAVSWLGAMSGVLPETARAIDSGDHSAADSNLEMQAVGYANLVGTSREQGVSTVLLEPMRALLDRARAGGLGGGDLSAPADLLRTGRG